MDGILLVAVAYAATLIGLGVWGWCDAKRYRKEIESRGKARDRTPDPRDVAGADARPGESEMEDLP